MPAKAEWAEIIRSACPEIAPEGDRQDGVSVRETLGLPLAGYRTNSSAAYYYYRGAKAYYWASSPFGNDRYGAYFSAIRVFPTNVCY